MKTKSGFYRIMGMFMKVSNSHCRNQENGSSPGVPGKLPRWEHICVWKGREEIHQIEQVGEQIPGKRNHPGQSAEVWRVSTYSECQAFWNYQVVALWRMRESEGRQQSSSQADLMARSFSFIFSRWGTLKGLDATIISALPLLWRTWRWEARTKSRAKESWGDWENQWGNYPVIQIRGEERFV